MSNGHARTNGHNCQFELLLTPEQLKQRADAQARRILNVESCEEAFALLDNGKLKGTIAEAEFTMLRHLMLV